MAAPEVAHDAESLGGLVAAVHHDHEREHARAHRRPLLVAAEVGQGGLDLSHGDAVGLPAAEFRDA